MSTAQGPHTSKGYDHHLAQAHALVLQMGARVERQTLDAIECLASGSAALIDQVLRHELVINSLERSIDELASHVIARRQPAANDLLFVAKALERIGDHAKNIAGHTIYAVKGAEVRHASVAEIEQELRG